MEILLVSHGTLSEGVNSALHMFAPGAENVQYLGLTSGEGGASAFRDALTAKVDELVAAGDVLILADIMGGTPYNESNILFMQNPEHVRLAAGLNLPMAIGAWMASQSGDLDAAYQAALTEGANAVQGTELLADDDDDDDDMF